MPDAPPVTALLDSSGLGCQRAAAVLLGIGPDVATAVFKALGEPELRRIALGAKELRTRGPQVMSDALEQFVSTMESVAGDAAAGDDLLRQVAERALGRWRAGPSRAYASGTSARASVPRSPVYTLAR